MKNSYREMMETINLPEGLSERVISSARETAERRPKQRRPLLRTAVCAACALALVMGTLTFRPADAPDAPADTGIKTPPALNPALSFGLTAYAAETGETIAPNANSGIAFSTDASMHWTKTGGYFSGCLFQITGEDIETVSLSLNRGELYRWENTPGLTEEEATYLFQVARELAGTDSDGQSMTKDESGYSVQKIRRIGPSVTEEYDPNVRYGLWTAGADSAAWEESARAASRESLDQLDGAVLTVRAVFKNGGEQTKTYHLSTGNLRASWNGDGTASLLPQLAGDGEISVYGVYAASREEGRYFHWPVAGANTVRLSGVYGNREVVAEIAPDEEADPVTPEQWERMRYHNGIDIPALKGTEITAVLDGKVLEAGFDAQEGNYLILDHGEGLETVYAHCQSLAVEAGMAVSQGEVIAAVGSTGVSTGPHLHFGVRQDGTYQDPVAYFDRDVRESLRAETEIRNPADLAE